MGLRKPKLKTWNTLLLLLIVVINGYVILAPLLPAVLFHVESQTGKRQQLAQKVASLQRATSTTAAAQPETQTTSQPNQVVIPSMLLDQTILQGPVSQTYKILDKGVWIWPNGSTPDKGGNTVLIGHRFTYTNPRGVFYFLNKVQLNDIISMYWNNKLYNYKVSSITVVPPTDTTIENSTPNAQLTIFTCTPLWLPKNRLVVVAQLETP